MFEKEAEEYREKEKDKGYYWVTQEMEQSELDTIVDESFKEGAEFGYNKANEWHYVKDELPISDKDKFYFVVDKWNEPMIARFYEGVWSNYSTIEDVIAWKEIVQPKEIKENER